MGTNKFLGQLPEGFPFDPETDAAYEAIRNERYSRVLEYGMGRTGSAFTRRSTYKNGNSQFTGNEVDPEAGPVPVLKGISVGCQAKAVVNVGTSMTPLPSPEPEDTDSEVEALTRNLDQLQFQHYVDPRYLQLPPGVYETRYYYGQVNELDAWEAAYYNHHHLHGHTTEFWSTVVPEPYVYWNSVFPRVNVHEMVPPSSTDLPNSPASSLAPTSGSDSVQSTKPEIPAAPAPAQESRPAPVLGSYADAVIRGRASSS